MSIDTKTAVLFCLPLLTIAVAWGESMSRLNTLEEQQSKLVTLNQLETIKVEIGYIKKQNEDNLNMLKQILGRINVK
jgi:hypothetical protein|tara:strand:- start:8224 stop:8454 length:231 start_codon:yes stop_codon:yes gene_type:complete